MEIGVNFNGDLPLQHIVEGSRIAEATGYGYIWIGEATEYMHPFQILALISHNTKKIKIGTGIISPLINNCYHIIEAFRTLHEVYGNRFVVGLAPGDHRGLTKTGTQVKHPLERMKSCISEFRRRLSSRVNSSSERMQRKRNRVNIPIYLGASGPKMIETASRLADGVLLNYVYPEFIKWSLKFFRESTCRQVSYGPALLKTDVKNLQLLRISAAIVFSGANKSFLKVFGLENEMVEVRRIIERKQFSKLKQYDDILLEKFAIYGSLKEVEEKVEEIQTLGMNQVVFATPLCRNLRSLEKIGAHLIDR